MKKIILIDNYDSFTFNLYHYLSSLKVNVDVIRNDQITSKEILKRKYNKIVISPGPGNPNQSANCVKIVKSLGVKKVIFLPDNYLAQYVASQTNVEIISWKGICMVHDQFNDQEIHEIRKNNPEIKIIAHPKCPPDVIKASDFAGSTSGMIKYVKDNQPKKVMMVTECSMSDNIQVENPNVEFIRPCNLCPHMKKITLPKILDCLKNETGEIVMDQETIIKAKTSVEKMAAIGR